MRLSVREMIMVGVGAALMAVFSQLSIPLPSVPLTLQVFGVVIISVILGKKLGTLSIIVFMLLGAIGLPVFAGFTGGLNIITGATGGYIIGFVFMAFIIGYFIEKDKKALAFIGAYLGLADDYIFGVIQLKLLMGLTLEGALVAGLYPFIIKDLILTALGIMVAISIRIRVVGVIKLNA
ncbi:MAG: biotin transporter BioY [Clostridium sp.]|nr:biotin transporter BioY [Clostridium sp.]